MKKALMMGLACLALLALMAAPTFACGGDKTTSASTTTGTDGKLVSADSKGTCSGMKEASAKTADGKSCCAKGASATSASATEDCSKCPYTGCEMVNMSIKGMTCGGCESTIRASLEKVPGVMKVMSVSYKDGKALVCMDPKKCKAESLTSAVSDKGYEAEVIPAVATSTDAKDAKSCAGMDKATCAAKCAAAKGEKTPKTDADSK
jgi:copper chaperone CopZ